MAFTPINSTDVESGKPASTTVLGQVKDNFDDHEDRIVLLESGVGQTFPPLVFRVGGPYGAYGARTALLKTTTNFAIEIIGVRLLVDVAGTTGTTEIDIKRKSGGGSFTSIFTTKPSLSYTAGNDSISNNAVLDSSQVTLSAGDILQLDLTSVQSFARGFTVRIDYVGA